MIFLDEPTADPRSRHTMWQIIRDLVASGVTIFLTTQYVDEADQLANHIALLDQGQWSPRIPDEIKRRIPGRHISLRFADACGLEAASGETGLTTTTSRPFEFRSMAVCGR